MRLASAELQTAADAAARAGARSLATLADTPQTSLDVLHEAYNTALMNKAIDNPSSGGQRVDSGVALDINQDIQFGTWSPSAHTFTFSPATSNNPDPRRGANAIKVEARRLKSRGTPLKLIFAPVLGVMTSDVERDATAYITGGNGGNFGFIGLQSVISNGDKAHIFGGTASDGTINLRNGDVLSTNTVVGDARPGMPTGSTVPQLLQKNNSQVDGWTANLDYQLTPLYPPIMVAPGNALAITPGASTYTFTGGSDAAHQVFYKGNVPERLRPHLFHESRSKSKADQRDLAKPCNAQRRPLGVLRARLDASVGQPERQSAVLGAHIRPAVHCRSRRHRRLHRLGHRQDLVLRRQLDVHL
jgi:Flp pilus assembly protein TadG